MTKPTLDELSGRGPTGTKWYYSFGQLLKDIDELERKIRASDLWIRGSIRNLYGIPAGGLIPVVLLAHRLSIPIVVSQRQMGPRTIVVDSVCDRGDTLGRHWGIAIGAAVLIKKPWAQVQPTFCVHTTRRHVQFFWETAASTTMRMHVPETIGPG